MTQPGKIRIRLVKGVNNTRAGHRATVRGLGLTRTNQTVEVVDTPATRGMIAKVSYLVRVVE